MKKKFEFHVDIQYTGWTRGFFQVEAETEAEAMKIAVERYKADRDAIHEEIGLDWDDLDCIEHTGKEELHMYNGDGGALVEVEENGTVIDLFTEFQQ